MLTLVNDPEHSACGQGAGWSQEGATKGVSWELSGTTEGESVRAVALDMCDTFYAAIAEVIPESWNKIVYDRFHVMQHVSKAVEKVRKQEHAYLLPHKRPEANRNPISVELQRRKSARTQARATRETQSRQACDWAGLGAQGIPTHTLELPQSLDGNGGLEQVVLLGTAQPSGTDEDVARRLRARLYNISPSPGTALPTPQVRGLNSAISTLIRRAYGYRNLQNQITAIYFYHGGLNLCRSQ